MTDNARCNKNLETGRSGSRSGRLLGTLFATALLATSISPFVKTPASAQQTSAKPNILVIFGDDVGQSNISAYMRGVVGYETPNVDRIANEGMIFTDYYAENSCTAGRSTFITGQACLRTGLCKVGVPGATVGLQKSDMTIAQALKPLRYATGQFGKNHFGDTAHGFDEFVGNLYHLNAEEEPERPYWPKNDQAFLKALPHGPVLHPHRTCAGTTPTRPGPRVFGIIASDGTSLVQSELPA